MRAQETPTTSAAARADRVDEIPLDIRRFDRVATFAVVGGLL